MRLVKKGNRSKVWKGFCRICDSQYEAEDWEVDKSKNEYIMPIIREVEGGDYRCDYLPFIRMDCTQCKSKGEVLLYEQAISERN